MQAGVCGGVMSTINPVFRFLCKCFIDALLCAELAVSKQWGMFWGAGTGYFYRKVKKGSIGRSPNPLQQQVLCVL